MTEERSIRLALVTSPDQDTARMIAGALVEKGLAACVNIIPGIRSIYCWKEGLQEDQEVLLLIKTRAELLDKVIVLVRELHPYQLPEIIALPISGGEKDYLDWIARETGEE